MSLKSHQKKQIALSKVIKKNNSAKKQPFLAHFMTVPLMMFERLPKQVIKKLPAPAKNKLPTGKSKYRI